MTASTAGSGVSERDAGPAAEMIAVDDLFFDEHNPRLQGRAVGLPQEAILEILWKEFAVDEVAFSIAANGFFRYEPVFAEYSALEGHDGQEHLAVVEGNRRLAAVKLLRSPALRRKMKATDLPEMSPPALKQIERMPVIVTPRADIWRFVGFKHVNGPQQWDAMAKAEYIAWVHNELRVSLADISRQIGDRHTTVSRLYSALMALQQAEETGVWHRERRHNKRFFFSHLYTGLGYSGIQEYLGFTSAKKVEAGKKNPVSKQHIPSLGNLMVWLYGDTEQGKQPLVKSQNPHLRQLDDALQSADGVTALERGLPLTVAVDVAKGDERILREALLEAKTLLQTAKARVVTGYGGDKSTLSTAEDVSLLADSIVEEMHASTAPGRNTRGRAVRR